VYAGEQKKKKEREGMSFGKLGEPKGRNTLNTEQRLTNSSPPLAFCIVLTR
jgi:hypothetical protein